MTFRPVPTAEEAQRRLGLIFSRTAFDTVMSSPSAAWALVSLIYIDAVIPVTDGSVAHSVWARPSTVIWFSDEALTRTDPSSRIAWRTAAARGRNQVGALLAEWQLPFVPKYADNSREGIRDETWPRWLEEGAMSVKPGVPTTSSAGRWALTAPFADLFDPALAEDTLLDQIEAFRAQHMSPGGKMRALTARRRGDQTHAVDVRLPDGKMRQLEPGDASLILKGVIEDWAPARLGDAVVVTISEPGDKIYLADQATMQQLGISIDQQILLPDALIVDIFPEQPQFWIIEAVASDGPIDEDRKRGMLVWAAKQRIPESSCRFLTAFLSRNAPPAKRRLKDLAVGTFAWYADEPLRELAWYEIDPTRVDPPG